MKEIWKDIPGTDGFYQASNMGRIRRSKPGNRTRIGHVLTPSTKNRRYHSVGIHIRGKRYHYNVHRLIALTFIGPSNGLEVNHINGDRADNRSCNLEYVTSSENSIHSIEVLGKWSDNKGEKNGAAKLTKAQVIEIRELWSTGKYFHREIAELYGVGVRAIGNIVNRKTWIHV